MNQFDIFECNVLVTINDKIDSVLKYDVQTLDFATGIGKAQYVQATKVKVPFQAIFNTLTERISKGQKANFPSWTYTFYRLTNFDFIFTHDHGNFFAQIVYRATCL